jgi:hypothetical protein
MSVQVVPVRTNQERERFLKLPLRLYANDPAWRSNLLLLQRDVLSEKKNPFFDHGEAQLFLALRNGAPVGRISAQIDRYHNKFHHERTGFFGFFESEENQGTADALFGAGEAWLRQMGMALARGPLNFSINEELGLLVEGFEHPPMVATTHALPYYGALIEGAGYARAMDMYAYRWEIREPPARIVEAVEQTRAYPGLACRRVNPWRLQRDVDILLDIYNDAWKDNWGYVPVTPREARKLASDLRLIADPDITTIVEIDGEPAGMVVGLPNLYEAICDFKGFLSPVNAPRLLWRLKVRGTDTGRILLFGVKKKFRGRDLVGLPFLLLHELYLGSLKGRYKWCEASWVLETNKRLNAIMPYWGAYVYKRYRLYEKAL